MRVTGWGLVFAAGLLTAASAAGAEAQEFGGGRALLEHLPVRSLTMVGDSEPEVRIVHFEPQEFDDPKTVFFRCRVDKEEWERAFADSGVITERFQNETKVFWRETSDTAPTWWRDLEGREGEFFRFGDSWVRDELGVYLFMVHFPGVIDGWDTFGKIGPTHPPTNGPFPRKKWAGPNRAAVRVWHMHTVRSPGKGAVNTAVAHDWDGDGEMDVIASYDWKVVLLKGPNWREYPIYAFEAGRSRVRPSEACIHSAIMDVDGDGDLDFCGSNQTVFWLECPKDPLSGQPWVYRTIDDEILGTHCLTTGDVNRDGAIDLIANSGRTRPQTKFPNSLTWLEVPENPRQAGSWIRHVFGDRDAPGGSHYSGLGDVNGDGRPDISFAAKGGEGFPGGQWFAWWEQPVDPAQPWKKHLLAGDQVGATNILPADLNGDGTMDFLASRGHGEGLLWFAGPQFKLIEIDPDILYPHCLVAADLDEDGDIDAATCSKDPGGEMVWFENNGRGDFRRHNIGADQGSYDLRAVDMDGDRDLDLLVAGHTSNNIVWFENPNH